MEVDGYAAFGTPRPHLRRPGRPHPPRDPGEAGLGGGHRDATRRAVRDEPAGHFQAPESARARRPRLDGCRCATASTQTGTEAIAGGRGLDRALPRDLRTELPAPRCVARTAPGQTVQAQADKKIAQTCPRSVSRTSVA